MINKINLKYFRCFKEKEISLDKKNIILGNNGTGKTSIIESLYICSNYRTINNKTKNSDLIKYGNKFCEITIESKNISKIIISKNKKIYIDNLEVNVIDFVREVKCVFFLADEPYQYFSSPSVRRKYFDQLIFNLNPNYLFLVQKYFRILKNRNRLLKYKTNDELDIWTNYLIDINSKIENIKDNYISEVCNCYNDIFKKIFGDEIHINIKIDKKKYQIGIEKREICNHRTLFGHHLEDYIFELNGKNINCYSSNGQKKAYLLILKLAHLSLSSFKYDIEQTIVIDDISSELDSEILNKFLLYLNDIENQVVLTSITEKSIGTFSIININSCQVTNGK